MGEGIRVCPGLATIARPVEFPKLKLKARALPDRNPPDPPIRVFVPFIGKAFYALQRSGRKIGIQFVAKSSCTISSLLCSRAKHRLSKEQESGVVYSIRCQCGSVYVGESGQELQMRMAQHRTQFNTGSNQSAFHGHVDCKPAYDPVTRKCFDPKSDSIGILAREQHNRLRLLTESALIRTIGGRETILVAPNDANVNRNSGTLLDERVGSTLSNTILSNATLSKYT